MGLGKNYKGLGKNYKGLGKNYLLCSSFLLPEGFLLFLEQKKIAAL